MSDLEGGRKRRRKGAFSDNNSKKQRLGSESVVIASSEPSPNGTVIQTRRRQSGFVFRVRTEAIDEDQEATSASLRTPRSASARGSERSHANANDQSSESATPGNDCTVLCPSSAEIAQSGTPIDMAPSSAEKIQWPTERLVKYRKKYLAESAAHPPSNSRDPPAKKNLFPDAKSEKSKKKRKKKRKDLAPPPEAIPVPPFPILSHDFTSEASSTDSWDKCLETFCQRQLDAVEQTYGSEDDVLGVITRSVRISSELLVKRAKEIIAETRRSVSDSQSALLAANQLSQAHTRRLCSNFLESVNEETAHLKQFLDERRNRHQSLQGLPLESDESLPSVSEASRMFLEETIVDELREAPESLTESALLQSCTTRSGIEKLANKAKIISRRKDRLFEAANEFLRPPHSRADAFELMKGMHPPPSPLSMSDSLDSSFSNVSSVFLSPSPLRPLSSRLSSSGGSAFGPAR